jgi:nucleotide-binding universal stress UspA family protein
MDIRNILVATDLSASADDAVRSADGLAKAVGAKLAVVHVMPKLDTADPIFPQFGAEIAQRLPDLRQRIVWELERRLEGLAGRAPDDYALVLEDGHAHVGILDAADRVRADLIVIASRGLTGVSRLLAGSVADKVIRHAHSSVLVVRPSPKSGLVLAATDFSSPSLDAVREASEWAKLWRGRLAVLHAVETPLPTAPLPFPYPSIPATLSKAELGAMHHRAREALRVAVRDGGFEAETHVVEGPPAASIVSAAEELEAQLVVVATEGRTGLSRVALGSVAERVAAAASCSVLVARPQRRSWESAA